MTKTKITAANYNNGKKSKRKRFSKKIDLYQKVATLDEAKKLLEKNIFPLVIVLNKNNNNPSQIISENYYVTSLLKDDNNIYMILDIKKLEQEFYDDKIYIDRFITLNNTIKYVDSMYHSSNTDIPIRIGLVKKRKLFSNKNKVEIKELLQLALRSGIEYIKDRRKEKVLTKEEIDDIHSRGKLTTEEIVEQWESFDLCVPGDNIGSASWRCEKFKNCHDCLIDYASYNSEHTPMFSHLKLTNLYTTFEEEEKIYQRLVNVLANQIDPNKLKEENVKQKRLQRKLEKSRKNNKTYN